MKYKKGFIRILISNIIALFIGLFTGFVLPKLLSIDTYANIKLFQLYITYTGFLHFGYSDGMYIKYGAMNIDKVDKKEIYEEYNTFCLQQILISILLFIVGIIFKNIIIILFAISIFPINAANYIRKLFQASGNFTKYAKYTNLSNISLFISNVIMLFIIKSNNHISYIMAYIFVYFLMWILLVLYLRELLGKNNYKYNLKYLISNIKSGFFIMIGNFCSIIFTSIDRFLIKFLLGIAKFAYYSFAVSLENLVNTFINPISIVMYNYLCEHKNNNDVLLIKRYLLIFSSFLVAAIFPITLIVNHFLSKYNESCPILLYLLLAQFYCIIIKCVHVNLYKVEKKQTKYFITMLSVILFAAVFDILSYYLTHSNIGFAVATMLVSILWLILCEVDFKQSIFRIKDYLFMIIIPTLLILMFYNFSPILGFTLYIIVNIIIIITLYKNEFINILNEAKSITKIKKGV